MTAHHPRIYLAGPDVFRSDAAAHFKSLVQACDALQLEGLRPFDGMVDVHTYPTKTFPASSTTRT